MSKLLKSIIDEGPICWVFLMSWVTVFLFLNLSLASIIFLNVYQEVNQCHVQEINPQEES